MMRNFEINSSEIDKIKKISEKEKDFRIKNLEFFNINGFPSKKLEDWKFSDFRDIVYKNFDQLDTKNTLADIKKINLLKDFDHNYILLVNGNLQSSNFDYEDKSKIRINSYKKDNINYETSQNSLVCLNNALAKEGYSLEVKKNYKFKKVVTIYNFFTKNLKNKILNKKNKITIKENSEIHIIDYTINESKFKFINNIYENVILEKNSKFKNISIQDSRSNGYFHKFSKNKLLSNSNYTSFIFSSGLKFNKLDIECDLEGKNSECNVQSALFLNTNDHQEIKTRINHLAENCKSYQKVKSVLSPDSKGVYQGKIYVKDIAQKTNAYQLSKALLLSSNSEFDSKPELEIYADNVKCSHGSTSGSIDEDSLYYLMTRGLNRKESTKLLIKGFLGDVVQIIKNASIKKFIQDKLAKQIYGY
jgi:Fe-S cluster assembly protein SufD